MIGCCEFALARQHAQRRVGEQRVAGADRVDQAIDEAVDDEERVRAPGGRRARQVSTPRRRASGSASCICAASIEARRQRPHAGILVAERKARLALVRRDQVEAAEVGDVAPAARDLAVGDL